MDGLAGGGARPGGHRGAHRRLHLPHARRWCRGSLGRRGARAADRSSRPIVAALVSIALLAIVRPWLKRRFTATAPQLMGAAAQVGRSAYAHRPGHPGRGPGQARRRDVVGADAARQHRARRGGRRRLHRGSDRDREPGPHRGRLIQAGPRQASGRSSRAVRPAAPSGARRHPGRRSRRSWTRYSSSRYSSSSWRSSCSCAPCASCPSRRRRSSRDSVATTGR